MPKRFTEIKKWDEPWFWELSPEAKLLWMFLCDHCDHAGIIDISLRIATAKIGCPIKEQHIAELEHRLHRLECGKFAIKDFIPFQYGTLSRDCKPHNPVFDSLDRHGATINDFTTPRKGFQKPLEREQAAEEDKEKEKEKREDCKGGAWIEKESEDQWEIAKRWLADWTKNGADYTEFEARGAFLALQAGGWQWGKRDITDPRAALERQIQTDRERKANGHSKTYQRPNPRLEGVSRNNAVNNYGEAAKRKLERQALEAANREAPKAEGT